jgi:hypothetical protein
MMLEFASAEPAAPAHQAWFGSEFKANRRTIKRLLDDLVAKENTTQDRAEFSMLVVQRKRLQAILAVCDFCKTKGLEHGGFVECFDSQKHFLSIEPEAKVEWPKHLLTHHFSHRARSQVDADSFWACLREAATVFSLEDLIAKQSALIAEKVIGLTKGDEVWVNLQKFFPRGLALQSFSSDLQKVGGIQIGTVCVGNDGETNRLGCPAHLEETSLVEFGSSGRVSDFFGVS